MPTHPGSPDAKRNRGKGKIKRKKGLNKAASAPSSKSSGRLATRQRVLTELLSK